MTCGVAHVNTSGNQHTMTLTVKPVLKFTSVTDHLVMETSDSTPKLSLPRKLNLCLMHAMGAA